MSFDGGSGALLLVGVLLLGAVVGGRIAQALRLPALTGHLAAGLFVGAEYSSLMQSSTELLVVVRQVASAALLFWVGMQLTRNRVSEHRRIVSHALVSVLVCVVVCATAIGLLADELAPSMGPSDIVVLALVLSATSPTVIAVVAQECDPRGSLSRAGLEGSLVANTIILVLAIVAHTRASSMFAWLDEVSAGLLAGTAFAVLVVAIPRLWRQTLLLAFAMLAVVGMRQPAGGGDAAVAIGALAAGAGIAQVRPVLADELATSLASTIPFVGLILFVIGGALIDIDLVLALAVPALLLFVIRGVALWLGARLAAGVDRSLDTSLGVVPWLPQAGFSLSLLAVLESARWATPLVSLAFVVVVLNELATPPLLHRVLARRTDELLVN